MQKLFVVFSLLIVASMLLYACGGTPLPSPTAAPIPTRAVVPTAVLTDTPQIKTVEVTPTVAAAKEFKSKDPTTLIMADEGVSVVTLDPALGYETYSNSIIQSTYDTLIFYDGEATDKFVPSLAKSWTVSPDGKTWVFTIRTGVKFHNGDDLTPSDVAFSFQRGLLQGGSASPQWLLAEPFLGVGNQDISALVDPTGALQDDAAGMSKADPKKLQAACDTVMKAVVADDSAGTVTFNLAQSWGPFLPTIAQTWGSVMDKKWVIAQKGWDGTCATWQNFYGMASDKDPFSAIENGSGPFKLESLKQGEEISLARNDAYWKGPAKLARVIRKAVPEWEKRFAMLQAGDADIITVQDANRSPMDALVGEKCIFDLAANVYKPCETTDPTKPLRVHMGRPTIGQPVILATWNIANDPASPNPYIGSGKLDGNGIPLDFFSDLNIRKGFAYCFDWDKLIADVYKGEATQSFQLPLPGMPGFFSDTPHYSLDLGKCEAAFKASTLKSKDGKSLWDIGFRLQMAYDSSGQIANGQKIAEILAANLVKVNPKFQVETVGLPLDNFLSALDARQFPIAVTAWQEDIHDPSNMIQPFTTGYYSGGMALPADLKAQFKTILDKGVAELDPAKRAEIYKEANTLYYDQAVGIPLVLATFHTFQQRWVIGEIPNPIFPDIYFYALSKN